MRVAPGYRTVLFIISLSLFGVIGWYLLSVKSVYIITTPQQAEITIDAPLKFKIGQRYLLLPGEYDVRAQAQGYHPLRDRLAVTEKNHNQQFTYHLQKLPGHLKVILDQALDARIFIDEEARGKAPATIRNIEPGEHAIRITADRYLPYRQRIDIEGLDREQTLEPQLQPAWAAVSVRSEPAGAELYIADQILGTTPLTAEIPQGRQTLRLRLDDHKPWQKTLNITAGDSMELHDIKLAKADAVITVTSKPDKANVTVNGQYRGQTPMQVAVEPNQRLDIRLFKQGYRAHDRRLTLNAGDRQKISVSLDAELTPVQFKVFPEDAELFIDGRSRGPANQTLELATHPHEIEIRSPGFLDHSATITPRKGIAQTVNVSLKSVLEAKREAIPTMIQTVAGQRLKLFRPDNEFTLGASRREPGRRANETLRKVKLTRAFYLSINEVSNAEYRLFAKDHSSNAAQYTSLDDDNNPVVNISWEQAALYCNWLSERDDKTPVYRLESGKITGYEPGASGYRLPTEAEWAWAARYNGPNEMLKFPWGEGFPPKRVVANFADQSAANSIAIVLPGYNDGYAATSPVGSFAANGKGLSDLAGNVSEWIHDYYDVSATGEQSGDNPMGPARGEHHVIRGSSWRHGTVSELRLSYRDYGKDGRDDLGFRIARYLE